MEKGQPPSGPKSKSEEITIDRATLENLQAVAKRLAILGSKLANDIGHILNPREIARDDQSLKLESKRIPTPCEVREIRIKLQLNVKEAAARIGVKPSSWYDWENPRLNRPPSLSVAILIRLLENGTI